MYLPSTDILYYIYTTGQMLKGENSLSSLTRHTDEAGHKSCDERGNMQNVPLGDVTSENEIASYNFIDTFFSPRKPCLNNLESIHKYLLGGGLETFRYLSFPHRTFPLKNNNILTIIDIIDTSLQQLFLLISQLFPLVFKHPISFQATPSFPSR